VAVVPVYFSTPTLTICPVVCTFPCDRISLNPLEELLTTLRNWPTASGLSLADQAPGFW
jgi:hypothetical protein